MWGIIIHHQESYETTGIKERQSFLNTAQVARVATPIGTEAGTKACCEAWLRVLHFGICQSLQ